jgi:hypothetical protein
LGLSGVSYGGPVFPVDSKCLHVHSDVSQHAGVTTTNPSEGT